MIVPVLTAAAAKPLPPAWFEYTVTTVVSGTGGAYEGYLDTTEASGRYELAPGEGGVRVSAHYGWSYTSSEGKRESGRVDRETSFDPVLRRYTGAVVDLDDPEYAGMPPGELATWLWLDPQQPQGSTVRVLATECAVLERAVEVPRLGVKGHHVRCSGSGHRRDDYGDMAYDWTEDWWYDAGSGWVLAQDLEERNTGTVEGMSGTFVRRSTLALTSASYVAVTAPPPRPAPVEVAHHRESPSPVGGCVALFGVAGTLGVWAVMLLVPIGLVWAVTRSRRVPDTLTGTAYATVRIAPLGDPLALVGKDTTACSKHFGPFLEDFVERARAAGDPVWTATTEDGRIVGLAWFEREAEIGTVLCSDPKIAANFARRLNEGKPAEFFTEHRHMLAGKPWFNLHERWIVLARRADEELAVDTSTVRRYTAADRTDVLPLLQNEWAGASTFGGWLDRQIERGDPAFVALVEGKVVGFALATVVGTSGRLALSVVAPAHRDRGLGSELVRARLTALHRLGVERVIVEVADWNVAPLHVLRKAGFEDAGELFVESSSPTRRRRAVVRR